ncbi:MAG: hypothetical protein K9W43_09070 [Candidatus Thorarchaeota archaeon]|nr:hypothetical protein [Candidatus Thorarchaeota archaeon]
MVKGPCRGRKCDFWTRVKIRKRSVESLASLMAEFLQPKPEGGGLPFEQAIEEFWKSFGVKDMPLLCKEEPDLCEKMKQVKEEVKKRGVVDSGETTKSELTGQ